MGTIKRPFEILIYKSKLNRKKYHFPNYTTHKYSKYLVELKIATQCGGGSVDFVIANKINNIMDNKIITEKKTFAVLFNYILRECERRNFYFLKKNLKRFIDFFYYQSKN